MEPLLNVKLENDDDDCQSSHEENSISSSEEEKFQATDTIDNDEFNLLSIEDQRPIECIPNTE